MTRTAFFIHDVGMYGATRSIALTLKTMIAEGLIENDDVHVFYNGKRLGADAVPSALFDGLEHKHACWLPVSSVFRGAPVRPFDAVRQFIRNAMCAVDWLFNYRRILAREDITNIHVNAHVMWPLLVLVGRRAERITMHVRDLLDYERFPVGSKLVASVIRRRADRIIAIDNLAAQPFIASGKATVLTNPFDMASVYELRRNRPAVYDRLGIRRGPRYVAMLGQISELKGAPLLVDVAKRLRDRAGIHFLLAGPDSTPYAKRIISEIRDLPNVTYLGEMMDVEQVYAVADVVVRCDAFLPLGRTLWEAYFAGCKVLAPARNIDDTSEIDYLLGNAMWLYRATDGESMARTLEQIVDIEIAPPSRSGNAAEYAKKFHEIVCRTERAAQISANGGQLPNAS